MDRTNGGFPHEEVIMKSSSSPLNIEKVTVRSGIRAGKTTAITCTCPTRPTLTG